jgi:ribosomal protein L31E
MGGGGYPCPRDLKVSIGFRNAFIGEAQISYGGDGARERAELAIHILKKRFKRLNLKFEELRFDLIGVDSLWPRSSTFHIPKEIRLRVAGRAKNYNDAEKICNEVEALYTNGPAGGGGVSRSVDESIAIISSFIPREEVNPTVEIMGGG